MRREDGRSAPGDDVEAVLDELYALPPSDFVARREERAARARTRRRAEDARRIHAARRPTLAGWAANLLRRSRPDEARRFLELGRALREAYATLDPGGLKELSAQRRRIVSEMSRQAAALAREAGHPLSDAVLRDVETTLRAVLADPEAAAMWEAGRVEGVLTPPSEFGAEAVAAAPAHREPPAPARTPRGDTAAARKKDAAARRKDAAAERRRAELRERAARAREERRAAEARLGERRAAREEAAAALAEAGEREREAGERVAALEEQLDRARTERERARSGLGEARERDRTAARDLTGAERAAAAAALRADKAEQAEQAEQAERGGA
ncbi:hypothetical protein AB0H44_25435 [Streptomyces pseudogriseolus]|uniref:Uncharacterized protein n=4 Tax=Streptomyces TaxID=1883 RepID=A0AB39NUM1_9ACTN|nr:hypothetical protein [Streptomyces rubiginosus]GGQ06258.1 hypothetical protein GCM10010233_23440 [Streptomyces gancidicus]GGS61759.1 hypothetical protein GCM10010285_46310 [Streptomyces rubiginosus]